MTNAARRLRWARHQQAHRDRRARGLTTYRLALDRLDVLHLLIDQERIDAADLDDHAKVQAALEEFICELLEPGGLCQR